MAYHPSTYKALIDEVGEGALADRLLEKWLKDDNATKCWTNLADDIYKINTDTQYAKQILKQIRPKGKQSSREGRENGGNPESSIKRWKVVLWYVSLGYQNEEVAVQLHCSIETVKEHVRRARKEMNLMGASQTKLIAEAIRQGIIP